MLNRVARTSRLCQLSIFRSFGAPSGAPAVKSPYPDMIWKKDTIMQKNTAATNNDEAYFCGIKPGTPREGWEILYYGTWLVIAGFAGVLYFAEDTTIQTWAHEEAKVRNKAKAEGVEIVYGKWYNKLRITERVEEDAEFERAEISVGYEYEKEGEEE